MKAFFCSIFLVAAISGIYGSPTAQADNGILVGTVDGFGVGSLTIDTNTGLEWLDWSESTNRSTPDVVGQFGSGGDFEGFRHATSREVITFLGNLNVGLNLDGYMNFEESGGVAALTPDNGESLLAAISFVGQTDNRINALPKAWAITADPLPDPTMFGLSPNLMLEPGILLELVGNNSVVNNAVSGFGGANFQIGHALVRPTTVPEPSSLLCLLGLGLIGLTGRRR